MVEHLLVAGCVGCLLRLRRLHTRIVHVCSRLDDQHFRTGAFDFPDQARPDFGRADPLQRLIDCQFESLSFVVDGINELCLSPIDLCTDSEAP